MLTGPFRWVVSEVKLKSVIDREFSFDQAREALLYSQSGRAKGKIVIRVN